LGRSLSFARAGRSSYPSSSLLKKPPLPVATERRPEKNAERQISLEQVSFDGSQRGGRVLAEAGLLPAPFLPLPQLCTQGSPLLIICQCFPSMSQFCDQYLTSITVGLPQVEVFGTTRGALSIVDERKDSTGMTSDHEPMLPSSSQKRSAMRTLAEHSPGILSVRDAAAIVGKPMSTVGRSLARLRQTAEKVRSNHDIRSTEGTGKL
jgi:hypothetical protein